VRLAEQLERCLDHPPRTTTQRQRAAPNQGRPRPDIVPVNSEPRCPWLPGGALPPLAPRQSVQPGITSPEAGAEPLIAGLAQADREQPADPSVEHTKPTTSPASARAYLARLVHDAPVILSPPPACRDAALPRRRKRDRNRGPVGDKCGVAHPGNYG
jgi:hypothetical protein